MLVFVSPLGSNRDHHHLGMKSVGFHGFREFVIPKWNLWISDKWGTTAWLTPKVYKPQYYPIISKHRRFILWIYHMSQKHVFPPDIKHGWLENSLKSTIWLFNIAMENHNV